MVSVKRATPFWLVVFSALSSIVAGGFWHANQVLAASSDDAVNYVRRDPEEYNFLPLVLEPDRSTGNTGAPRDTLSYNLAYDQGYEVQCARPAWEISPHVYGAIREYFENHSGQDFGGDASYDANFSTGRVPLFRGDEALTDTRKISSFEGYFGANNQNLSQGDINASGVANVLLGSVGQCEAKYRNLDNLFGDDNLCSKLKDGDQCVLDRPISGSSLTTQQLYERLTALFQYRNAEGRNFSCSDLMGALPAVTAEFGMNSLNFDRDIRLVQEAVTKAPLNLDILYRLAFLIITPQQNIIENGDDVFDFLQTRSPAPNAVGHSTIPLDWHAPIIVGFKVPFVATNSILSLPGLQDSARLTGNTLRSVEQLETEQTRARSQRETFVNSILENKNAKPIINCDGLPQCSGGQDESALVQALVDLINGSGQTCAGFRGPYERAGDLGSRAVASEEKEFQSPYFSEVLPAENSATFNWNLTMRDINTPAVASRDKVPVTAHLVTPYGADLQFLEGSLRALFGSEELATRIQENCIEDFRGECGLIPEFFTFGGISSGLNSEESSFSFIYDGREECDSPLFPIPPEDCNRLSISGGITEQPVEVLRVMGAQIGWFVQQIQLKFRGIANKAHTYIQECKRTEDLFLGRCLGFQEPGGGEGTVANSCVDYQEIMVDIPSDYMELGKIVCGVANNNPKDVQLLWGMVQVDGWALHHAIRAGESSISCRDAIMGPCGSSQIAAGIIVPQCVDRAACPQVNWAFTGNAGEQYQKEITMEVACSVRGGMEYILKTRKQEMAWLREQYRSANGTDPSTDQLYYMMAGRNAGLPMANLVQPKCGGVDPVDPVGVGPCGGVNYCECVMDVLTYTCGQQV